MLKGDSIVGIRSSFRLDDYLEVIKTAEGEHYKFEGKMPLDTMFRFLVRHFSNTELKVVPEPIILALAWDRHGHTWIMNRASVDDEDAEQVIPDEDKRRGMWEPRMNIHIRALRFYNPWRETPNECQKSMASMHNLPGTSPILTKLDCSANEAAGLIHEVMGLHIMGHQPHYEVAQFLNNSSVSQAAVEDRKPSRKAADKPVFEAPPRPSWFHPGW